MTEKCLLTLLIFKPSVHRPYQWRGNLFTPVSRREARVAPITKCGYAVVAREPDDTIPAIGRAMTGKFSGVIHYCWSCSGKGRSCGRLHCAFLLVAQVFSLAVLPTHPARFGPASFEPVPVFISKAESEAMDIFSKLFLSGVLFHTYLLPLKCLQDQNPRMTALFQKGIIQKMMFIIMKQVTHAHGLQIKVLFLLTKASNKQLAKRSGGVRGRQQYRQPYLQGMVIVDRKNEMPYDMSD